MIINHNLGALSANKNMNINSGSASKSIEKLSSGLRINKTLDDVAVLAISEKIRGEIRVLDQASATQKIFNASSGDVKGDEMATAAGAQSDAGLTFTFTAGIALNGYTIITGSVSAFTPTTASVDTTNKIITLNGDFSGGGTVTTANAKSAIDGALSTAGLSQSVTIGGTSVATATNISSKAFTGGTDTINAEGALSENLTSDESRIKDVDMAKGEDEMDIGALSIIMSQSKLQVNIGISVMKLAMNSSEQSAAQMTEMMGDTTLDPNLGNNLDISA